MERILKSEITLLITARQDIELLNNQQFYETSKAYEIWETKNDLLYFVKRIDKKRVSWIIEK